MTQAPGDSPKSELSSNQILTLKVNYSPKLRASNMGKSACHQYQ